jgi:MEMO1 family protein
MEVSGMWETTARPAICADDRWYPSQPKDLERIVTKYIEAAPQEQLDPIYGIIAPHAGYFFSGHVAGAAYRQIQGHSYNTVVLIGPDHTGIAAGATAVPNHQTWQTPLGEVPVAIDHIETLKTSLHLRHVQYDREHSLEVQVPFLQITLADFRLLPIIMGDHSPATCRALGEALAQTITDSRTLFVASTDLSHFFPDHEARRLDERTLEYVLHYDPAGLCQAIARGEAHACGGGPVAAAMWAAKALGANQAHLLKYATSADVWDDKSRVVGYAAAVLTR